MRSSTVDNDGVGQTRGDLALAPLLADAAFPTITPRAQYTPPASPCRCVIDN